MKLTTRLYQVYSRAGFESAHASLAAARRAAQRVANKKGDSRVFKLAASGMNEVLHVKAAKR